jgi:hypothetical protein
MSAPELNYIRARGVYRANSAVYLPPGQQLQVMIKNPDQDLVIRMGTYRIHGKLGPVPNGIWITGEGRGRDLQDAELHFRNAVDDAAGVISFLTNAAIEEPTLEILYDITPESLKHEAIFMSQTSRYSTPPSVVRESPKFVRAGMKALAENEKSERLWRAISSYITALRSWRKGHEPVSFGFLYMAMEALTPIAREPLFEKFGDAEGLAKEWKIEKRQVDGEVRKRVLFNGDQNLYRSAKLASDSLEHGFGEMGDIAATAEAQVTKLAAMVRAYVISQLFDGGRREVLTSDIYSPPLGYVPSTAVVRGVLEGNQPNLVHPDQHPVMNFTLEATHMVKGKNSDWQIQWDISEPSPELAEGVEFTPESSGLNSFEV